MGFFDLLEFIFDLLEFIFDYKAAKLADNANDMINRNTEHTANNVAIRSDIRTLLFTSNSIMIILMILFKKNLFWMFLILTILMLFATSYILSHSIKIRKDDFTVCSAFGKRKIYKYKDIIFIDFYENKLKFNTSDSNEYKYSSIFSNTDIFYDIANKHIKTL